MKGGDNMSKYLLSAGVVWVFLCFVVGVIILVMPNSNQEMQPAHYRRPFKDQLDESGPRNVTSNVAKTSVQIEGTASNPQNAAETSVQIKK